MNESSDALSVSPSQLLARLQALRSLQDAARDKLEKQKLMFEGREVAPPITLHDLLAQVSMDSSSYQAFMQLLDSSRDRSPCNESHPNIHRIHSSEQMEGVSELNLSLEREDSRPSARAAGSSPVATQSSHFSGDMADISTKPNDSRNYIRKCIDLDNIPVISPRQDFEQLVLENIQGEKPHNVNENSQKRSLTKPFLKRGQGLTRFGLKKDDLVIQNTKSLPWRRKSTTNVQNLIEIKSAPASLEKLKETGNKKVIAFEKRLSEPKGVSSLPSQKKHKQVCQINVVQPAPSKTSQQALMHGVPQNTTKPPNNTSAAKLTTEQDNFLKQLKQSSFYKHFESPVAVAAEHEISCDESLHKVHQQREKAEQNLFEFLEKKVNNASFSSESSFLQKFLKSKPDCSGDNTPITLKKCLTKNPQLLQLFPAPKCTESNFEQTAETCECTECDETCSTTSSCSTCRKIEDTAESLHTSTPQVKEGAKQSKTLLDDTITPTNKITAEMADMNAKIVATNELLKERLKELDSEIETFRQENANLTRLRQEFDEEKKKFYEEKAASDQKSSEDKILSEYYLAEEKEKLVKQKQTYERYIREIKGQLNRKEKEEVLRLKKEIEELKEEFRNKEARSTASVARLRTQLKIMEKEKNDLIDECEKLKRENKRIQQVNTTTRRLSNLKYLSEINKKLAQIDAQDKLPKVVPDNDAHFKSIEIESRGRTRKQLPIPKHQLRVRARSVPNLSMVTSHYAKYFSQRDAETQRDYTHMSDEHLDNSSTHSDKSSDIDYNALEEYEKLTPHSSNGNNGGGPVDSGSTAATHVLTGSSPPSSHESLVPPLNLSRVNYTNRSKSPVSILSNRSLICSQKSKVINLGQDKNVNLEDELDKNSRNSATRTSINPSEIKRPDGTRELRFPNGNVKILSADGKTSKFMYYNGDIKETFIDEGKIKYYYCDLKTYHTTYVDGLEVLEFPDGQVEKRYPDGSDEIRLPNGSVRYTDPRNRHVSEEWRFPDGAVLTVARDGEQRVRLPNGQIEVHANDHKRREYPDGTVKVVYADGSSETRYASGRVRIRDKRGALVCDSAASDT